MELNMWHVFSDVPTPRGPFQNVHSDTYEQFIISGDLFGQVLTMYTDPLTLTNTTSTLSQKSYSSCTAVLRVTLKPTRLYFCYQCW